MHSTQPIGLTYFQEMADNQAKSTSQLWPEVAAMLSAPHASALSHKSSLPLFSPWIYKEVTDTTVSNGTDSEGKLLKHFSNTHVRRISANLVEMTMLVLDYDGGRPIAQIRELFRKWEHVFYTTLNHREEEKDKGRVVLPLATSIPVAKFVERRPIIEAWTTGLGADPSTADIGRMFILPAVRDEQRHLAQSWHHEGVLLDWRMFSEMPMPAVAPTPAAASPFSGYSQLRKLAPGDVGISVHRAH